MYDSYTISKILACIGENIMNFCMVELYGTLPTSYSDLWKFGCSKNLGAGPENLGAGPVTIHLILLAKSLKGVGIFRDKQLVLYANHTTTSLFRINLKTFTLDCILILFIHKVQSRGKEESLLNPKPPSHRCRKRQTHILCKHKSNLYGSRRLIFKYDYFNLHFPKTFILIFSRGLCLSLL